MGKRKREHGDAPSRKSARLAEKCWQPSSSALIQTPKPRALPSPSSSGLARGDHPQSPENNKRKSPNDTNFVSAADRQRKHDTELIQPKKKPRKSEPAEPQLQPNELVIELAPTTSVLVNESEPAEPPLQPNEPVVELAPTTSVLVNESSASLEKASLAKASLEKELEVSKKDNGVGGLKKDNGAGGLKKDNGVGGLKKDNGDTPISYWAAHHTWPDNFAEKRSMASSGNVAKRPRTSSSPSRKLEKPPSYSQSRKDGTVPEQYSAAYEQLLFTKGLDMNFLRGERFVGEQSQESCRSLARITRHSIIPSIFPQDRLREVIDDLAYRNEAIVYRDVTPMILPPIMSLFLSGETHLEHVIDEVTADWHEQCILIGPRLRPDRAIGLLSSAFTKGELDKLERYKSIDNWTHVTGSMYFPFLMIETKCGRDGLDVADRQNMHSCSVAVRAILRIEQEADKYRAEAQLDKRSGQILVYSISHDRQDVRLYGHYATIQGAKWTYYRYRIDTCNILTSQRDLLTLYNFCQNVLEVHLLEHVERLQRALLALPEPDTPPLDTSSISLNDGAQQDLLERDEEGFAIPARPDASQSRESARTEDPTAKLLEQISKLMAQLEVERKKQEEERKKHEEERKREQQEHREQQKELMALLKSSTK